MEIIIWIFLLYGASVVSYHTVIYEYRFINTRLTWAEARNYCRDHYTDLATFWSRDDIYRVWRFSGYGGYAWIGLFDDPDSWKGVMTNDSNSWRWSATETTSPGGYQKWLLGQPDYYGGKHLCVYIYNSQWYDDSCNNVFWFVCFTGFTEPGQKNYTLITTLMTWEDARSYCRQYYTDLAMIQNENENIKVGSLLPGTIVWIGLYREPWRWSDGSQINYTNWYSGNPDTGDYHCALEESTYLWNDMPCNYQYPFICHQDVTTRERVILTTFQSAADLSQPGTHDQIIEQVRAELERKGITDFRLKWKTPPHIV